MKKYGLIGHPISHSFSKKYFSEKFEKENISNCSYELFDIETLNQLSEILKANPNLKGLNVTIPHKENILSYITDIDDKIIQSSFDKKITTQELTEKITKNFHDDCIMVFFRTQGG